MRPSYRGVLRGGAIATNFCNTVDARLGFLTTTPSIEAEHLQSVHDLLDWMETATLLSAAERKSIVSLHKPESSLMVKFLREAISVRELLFRIFLATIRKDVAEAKDVVALNKNFRTFPHPEIVAKGTKLLLEWEPSSTNPRILLSKILQDGVSLLTSSRVERLKYCAAEDCGWLFVDDSKNNSRRWCDMADCGNREKAARYYESLKRNL